MTAGASFFERRRAGILAERRAEAAAARPEAIAEGGPDPEAPDLEGLSDGDILELLDLPEPESMVAGDNFAAFMTKAVPLHLRNRALRRLWRSDPVLACLDGLNDYDTDYLTGSTGQGVIQTSYQVGKGLLAHVERLAAAAPKAEEVDEAAEAEIAMPEEDAPAEVQEVAEVDTAPAPALPPRRMRFAFAGGAA